MSTGQVSIRASGREDPWEHSALFAIHLFYCLPLVQVGLSFSRVAQRLQFVAVEGSFHGPLE
jgi:hypothetical protein